MSDAVKHDRTPYAFGFRFLGIKPHTNLPKCAALIGTVRGEPQEREFFHCALRGGFVARSDNLHIPALARGRRDAG